MRIFELNDLITGFDTILLQLSNNESRIFRYLLFYSSNELVFNY
jgi:hypothetical protein